MVTEFTKRLEIALTNKNIKQTELVEMTGISKSAISQYLSGAFEPKQNNIYKIAKALDINPVWLMGKDVAMDNNMIPKPIGKPVRINVYGSIPAGIPLEAIQDIQDWEEIPAEWTKGGKEYIALIVKGDSMYPKYLEGDTVIIQLQKDCDSGQDCACYVNGYEATLKTVKKEDKKIELKPINPNYPPKTYKHPGEVTILGVVKELRRKM